MSKFVVVCANKYSFVSDGKKVEGCKITYFDRPENNDTVRGYQPLVVNCDINVFDKLKEIPAVYDIDFKMVPGPKGKVSLLLNDINYLSNEISL